MLESERESKRSCGSCMREVCERDGGGAVEMDAWGGGGGLEWREAELVPGVLAREVEVSIRRTAGARWRRRVRKE